ncbi:MAG: tryptophan-rich sensory protein [Clostridia bacterium]|nr:tryptophan-rich sensory protein [Clostridia bacterium]
MWKKIKERALPYLIGIVIPLAVGSFAAILTRDAMDIYGVLRVPPLAPPAILFPIVWSVLYILMGVSSTTVYLNRDKNPAAASLGLKRYFLSLVFNFFWSIIFFRLRSVLAALVTVFLLIYLVISTVISYKRVSRLSALLQIPYLAWLVFAAYLNAGIYLLN